MNETVTIREQKPRKRIEIPRLAVSKRFGMYKDEEKKEVRKADVKEGVMSQLLKRWEEYNRILGNAPIRYENEIIEGYVKALDAVRGACFSPEDVDALHVPFMVFHDMEDYPSRAGLFLSALINSGKDESYLLNVDRFGPKMKLCEQDFLKRWIDRLHTDIRHLGYRNSKNLIIEGNLVNHVGDNMLSGSIVMRGYYNGGVGLGMENGTITVEGKTGGPIGMNMLGGTIMVECCIGGDGIGMYMEGGTIVIRRGAVKGADGVGARMNGGYIQANANVDGPVGSDMSGGVIVIRGNVTGFQGVVGSGMTGGEIYMDGEIRKIGDVKHGKIFHWGRLIVDK